METTAALVFIFAASLVALVVFLAVSASTKKDSPPRPVPPINPPPDKPPKEDPKHVIERLYQYPGRNDVWVCRNCECENDAYRGSCCVCNHVR